jgi:hypothetical protein
MPPSANSKLNLNTIIGLLSILSVIGTCVFFLAPLKTLPGDVRDMQHDVRGMQQTQAVQTEALKTLAEVASDTKTMRRDVDKHESALESVKERLGRLERQ